MIATQIPKPRDEQDFERCNLVLWRCILKDETTHLYGRRGQRQHGVDILGCRNANPNHLVGIQCKLKTDGQQLREREVRDEVEKALTFKPLLSEYVVVTTGPDDAKLQSLAKELSICVSKSRHPRLRVAVLGWDNLQLEIQRYPDALKAFDPSHTPQGDQIQKAIENIPEKVSTALSPEIEIVRQEVAALRTTEIAIVFSTVQSEHEKLINDYVALIPGEAETALGLLQKLEARLAPNASDHVHFRIQTNIAACQLRLGQESAAASGLIAAWSFAPGDPKAIANKAFGFLLLGNWDFVKEFAAQELKKRPSNARLAACYVRSLIHDEATADPISLVPEQVSSTPEVLEAHVQWLMERGDSCSWWDAAIAAHRKFPESVEMRELGASALLSRAIGGERYIYGQTFDASGHADVKAAIQIYETLWPSIRDRSAQESGTLLSVPINLMIAYRIVGNEQGAIDLGWKALERFPMDDKLRECLATFLVDQGDTVQASELISGLEENLHVVTIRYKIAVANEDWSTVLELVDAHLDKMPDSEQVVARAMRIVARTELAAAS